METRDVNRAYENIVTRLRAVRRQWRWLIFSESVLKCFAILALLMTSTLIILTVSFQAWQSPFSRWIRIAILLFAIGGAIYAVIRTLILPLCGKFTDIAVAARLESTQTETEFSSQNRILSAIQLRKNLTDNPLGYAPEFIEHLIVQAGQDVEQLQPERVFQTRVSED